MALVLHPTADQMKESESSSSLLLAYNSEGDEPRKRGITFVASDRGNTLLDPAGNRLVLIDPRHYLTKNEKAANSGKAGGLE